MIPNIPQDVPNKNLTDRIFNMSIMIIILITIAVILLFVLIAFKSDSQSAEPLEPLEIPKRKEPVSTSESFRIVGISKYCTLSDVGIISGELIDEPENKYDKDAVVIIDANKNQVLGYVSKNDKKAYRKIAQGKNRMPFVGYIESFVNEEGKTCVFGIVRTYAGDEETVLSDAQNDWDFLQSVFKIRPYDSRMAFLEEFKY